MDRTDQKSHKMTKRTRRVGYADLSIRSGFTLIELIVVITLSVFVIMSIVSILQMTVKSAIAVVDSSDMESQAGQAMHSARTLLKSAIRPPDARFVMQPFGNLPGGWNQPHQDNNLPYVGGIHFVADVDQDGQYEWVWIWVDPTGGATDPQAEIRPRPPYLKATAFHRMPTSPSMWATYGSAFYNLINDDKNAYIILASDLTSWGDKLMRGQWIRIRQGFGIEAVSSGYQRADVIFSCWTDRNLSSLDANPLNDYDSGEPVVFLREQVFLANYVNPAPAAPMIPDPRYLSAIPSEVRDSCFPMNGNLAQRLVAP